jgi:hypothetical protein
MPTPSINSQQQSTAASATQSNERDQGAGIARPARDAVKALGAIVTAFVNQRPVAESDLNQLQRSGAQVLSALKAQYNVDVTQALQWGPIRQAIQGVRSEGVNAGILDLRNGFQAAASGNVGAAVSHFRTAGAAFASALGKKNQNAREATNFESQAPRASDPTAVPSKPTDHVSNGGAKGLGFETVEQDYEVRELQSIVSRLRDSLSRPTEFLSSSTITPQVLAAGLANENLVKLLDSMSQKTSGEFHRAELDQLSSLVDAAVASMRPLAQQKTIMPQELETVAKTTAALEVTQRALADLSANVELSHALTGLSGAAQLLGAQFGQYENLPEALQTVGEMLKARSPEIKPSWGRIDTPTPMGMLDSAAASLKSAIPSLPQEQQVAATQAVEAIEDARDQVIAMQLLKLFVAERAKGNTPTAAHFEELQKTSQGKLPAELTYEVMQEALAKYDETFPYRGDAGHLSNVGDIIGELKRDVSALLHMLGTTENGGVADSQEMTFWVFPFLGAAAALQGTTFDPKKPAEAFDPGDFEFESAQLDGQSTILKRIDKHLSAIAGLKESELAGHGAGIIAARSQLLEAREQIARLTEMRAQTSPTTSTVEPPSSSPSPAVPSPQSAQRSQTLDDTRIRLPSLKAILDRFEARDPKIALIHDDNIRQLLTSEHAGSFQSAELLNLTNSPAFRRALIALWTRAASLPSVDFQMTAADLQRHASLFDQDLKGRKDFNDLLKLLS